MSDGILLCRTCMARLSLEDYLAGGFDLLSMTCMVCFRKLYKEGGTCFGNYQAKHIQCRRFCGDRKVCAATMKKQRVYKISESGRAAALQFIRDTQKARQVAPRANRSHPYPQKGSIMHKIYNLALKGVKKEDLRASILAIGGNPGYYLTKLRRGHEKGFTWTCDETRTTLTIHPTA